MSGEFQIIYDASAPGFKFAPLLVVCALAVVFTACFRFVEAVVGEVSRKIKVITWGGLMLYALLVSAGYWAAWQQRNDALNATDARIVDGNLTDGWRRTTLHRRSTTTYQHFTVNGVEFVERDLAKSLEDFLFPLVNLPPLPLIENAHVRVTYRGDGEHRTILKFEIAAADLAARHD